MEDWIKSRQEFFESYVNSFSGLTPGQQKNFRIKKDHSLRVAENAGRLGNMLKLNNQDRIMVFLAGLFHDIGRFRQLIEFNTFNDNVSVDHARYSVDVLKEKDVFSGFSDELKELVYFSILFHNKFQLPPKRTKREYMHARLLRDADKLDILKVLSDYYSDRNQQPNHTLTWELPKSNHVSSKVAQEILAGKLVSKDAVKNQTDVKVMQLSWVFDLNFKPSFELIFEQRFFEKIYNSLPKNDLVIEIYRKIKIYTDNKLNT